MLGASSTSMPSGLVVAIVALGRLAVDQHRQAFLEAEAVAVGEALLLLSLVARSCAPMASSPRINTQGQALSDAAAQEARLRSSSLRVLRRQGAAKTQATLSGKPLSCASISVP